MRPGHRDRAAAAGGPEPAGREALAPDEQGASRGACAFVASSTGSSSTRMANWSLPTTRPGGRRARARSKPGWAASTSTPFCASRCSGAGRPESSCSPAGTVAICSVPSDQSIAGLERQATAIWAAVKTGVPARRLPAQARAGSATGAASTLIALRWAATFPWCPWPVKYNLVVRVQPEGVDLPAALAQPELFPLAVAQ